MPDARTILVVVLAALVASCEHHGPTPQPVGAAPSSPERLAKFEFVANYQKGDKDFQQIKRQIKEGDLIAYWMTDQQTHQSLLGVRLSALPYLWLDYGHLAIAVKLPDRAPPLRLYSSLPGIGSHFSGGLDELEEKNFTIFRLDRWDELSETRLREFAHTARKKSRNIFGYDYIAASGLWSDNLKPKSKRHIEKGYMCSTSVAAALHYAGLDLINVRRRNAFQIISPKRVFTSKGRIMNTSQHETAPDSGGK